MNPLTNFYNLAQTETSSAIILFNILLAFALSMSIVWLWRHTHKGLSYSQSFAFTIAMLAPLAAVVMMIVQNNLIGAFALLGAFSLIRFRTIIKETRDVAFLFFSLTIGVAVGTNNYTIAAIATIAVSAIILALYRINFGSGERTGFLLTIEGGTDLSPKVLDNAFATYTQYNELLHAKKTTEETEYAFSLHLKDPAQADAFMEAIKKIPHITKSFLITGKELIEY
ncbi:MAG: hypothetical protein A3C84_03820 [Candidatus Ryanbacteria bacterium RIFCSPHIGHO2_02_FULL_48_12]|uniref:DUF4956 domain-containing protein n=1 Tax=Candidatus Ryanbacteria bacterium RIFCSPHIGHO2_01_FULL_48_27 TaxID=1802115 RepID=A0A1G2G6D7_9BACT|nr:MAG: hypothetical protein A2756_00435 [Candidatus Ryanbacteria bacterium RIFCSPHIGHO2_01_FULL_48_27]OGZ48906.1 MAG: hypothetical protein A3C84_03820 [Candidatus Ryanbacteria bacterium RIFCSPHIGHO2_02_FULL_48_12]